MILYVLLAMGPAIILNIIGFIMFQFYSNKSNTNFLDDSDVKDFKIKTKKVRIKLFLASLFAVLWFIFISIIWWS